MKGCGGGGTRVDVHFPAPHVMYLRRGWKTFTRIHSLTARLSIKVFEDSGTRLKCCMESSSYDEDSSSSENDKEDSCIDEEGSRQEDDGSD